MSEERNERCEAVRLTDGLQLSVGVHIGCVVCCEQRRLESEERQHPKTESLRLNKACVVGQPGIALDPPDGDGSSQVYPLRPAELCRQVRIWSTMKSLRADSSRSSMAKSERTLVLRLPSRF
jgi:hypothetical protein